MIRDDDKSIAYLVSYYPKVSHTFVRREILALEALGWNIHRFAARGWDADVVDGADVAEIERTSYILRGGAFPLLISALVVLFESPRRLASALKLSFLMMRPSDRPFYVHLVYVLEACWLSRQLRMRGVRHLHAHFGTNPAAVAVLTHELIGIPFSFTVHGPEEFDKAPLIHLDLKIRNAEFVVAVSAFGRSQLLRLVDYSYWSRVHVVHCGVDRLFLDGSGVDICMDPRLLCIGRLCEQKGQLLLVSAAARLIKRGCYLKVILVGDGEMRPEIERLIARHKLDEVVTIAGWADGARVRSEILRSRAIVLPSFAEGLPVSLMEAMALGRPVISTYIAGIPELVIDKENGWLVPAGDEEALADAMLACLDADTATLARLGQAARRRVSARHDIDCEAKKLSTIFKSVLAVERDHRSQSSV